ncbi:ferritin-like domain-containing protein [Halarcobacter anaerophilus]|jgi:rubrerythrin|uniref:Rubrerythrin diiron-binding domain-containing protein n=1 Tax=Halarcobacter anaerophilus TaxID=877500 RepID=A0A4Q0Y117_9BACT|nr:ferritin family protein [Halarcobacter anaerophilus]QDF28578.1 ferritin_like_AB domain-containing protein [Halarcobacter anaerophilus]RXJ63303.1 hypothetical protein CRV06_06400 [Halarcobacter anaerophilus]
MNVYEYAMKVEKEGESYYRQMAEKAENSGLKRIFTMLADEEVKHYNIFRNMMKNEDMDLDKLDLITDTETIFKTLNEERDNVNLDSEHIQYYKEAIDREDNSFDFYASKAKELENKKEKEIFLQIANEEKKHKRVLEEIVLYLEEPASWVACAEF